MSDKEESRFCPYCGIKLKHPYWEHIQSKHADKYAQKETWIKLYQDYRKLGMDEIISLTVISELFNSTIEEIKSFLKSKNALQLTNSYYIFDKIKMNIKIVIIP